MIIDTEYRRAVELTQVLDNCFDLLAELLAVKRQLRTADDETETNRVRKLIEGINRTSDVGYLLH